MIFSVKDYNKATKLYLVTSNEGEHMYVTGYQIIQVMLKGYCFTNVQLYFDGIKVKLGSDIKIKKIAMEPNIKQAVYERVVAERNMRQAEEERKRQEAEMARMHEKKIQEASNIRQITSVEERKHAEKAKVKAKVKVNTTNIKGKINGNNRSNVVITDEKKVQERLRMDRFLEQMDRARMAW